MREYEITVSNEYREEMLDILDDLGFDARKQLSFSDDESICSVEIQFPGMKRMLLRRYSVRLLIGCPLSKYLFVRINTALLRAPKGRIRFKRVG